MLTKYLINGAKRLESAKLYNNSSLILIGKLLSHRLTLNYEELL